MFPQWDAKLAEIFGNATLTALKIGDLAVTRTTIRGSSFPRLPEPKPFKPAPLPFTMSTEEELTKTLAEIEGGETTIGYVGERRLFFAALLLLLLPPK